MSLFVRNGGSRHTGQTAPPQRNIQLYLATMDITKKWGGRNRDWNQILAHLCIYFDDRISLRDID